MATKKDLGMKTFRSITFQLQSMDLVRISETANPGYVYVDWTGDDRDRWTHEEVRLLGDFLLEHSRGV